MRRPAPALSLSRTHTSEMIPFSSTRIWSFITLYQTQRTDKTRSARAVGEASDTSGRLAPSFPSLRLTLHRLQPTDQPSVSVDGRRVVGYQIVPGAPTSPVPTSSSSLFILPTYQDEVEEKERGQHHPRPIPAASLSLSGIGLTFLGLL